MGDKRSAPMRVVPADRPQINRLELGLVREFKYDLSDQLTLFGYIPGG
jgi:hypothetical protein